MEQNQFPEMQPFVPSTHCDFHIFSSACSFSIEQFLSVLSCCLQQICYLLSRSRYPKAGLHPSEKINAATSSSSACSPTPFPGPSSLRLYFVHENRPTLHVDISSFSPSNPCVAYNYCLGGSCSQKYQQQQQLRPRRG